MRKTFASIPGRTTTTGAINNSVTGAVLLLTSGTGWPTAGPFVVVMDPGTLTEEWILCDSRASLTVTINAAGRGYVGAAAAHANGAVVHVYCVDYLVTDEFNSFVNLMTGKGQLIGHTGSAAAAIAAGVTDGQLLKRLAAAAQGVEWSNVGTLLAASSTVDGQGWYSGSNDETEGWYFYDGTSGQRPWNTKWGLAAQPGIQPSSQTIQTPGADITGMTVTFTSVVRRWYRYTWVIELDNNASIGNVNTGVELRDGSNTTLQAWGLVTQGGGSPQNQHNYRKCLIRQEAGGVVTRKMWSNGIGVSGMRFGSFSPVILGQLFVEDIGPVTGAPA